MEEKEKAKPYNGILKNNLILTEGLLLPLVFMSAGNFVYGLYTSLAFLFMAEVSSFLTAAVFNNKKNIYGMTASAIMSSLCYIPVYMICEEYAQQYLEDCKIYFPLLIICSVWVYAQNSIMFKNRFAKGASSVFHTIIISIVTALIISFLTDFFDDGEIFGYEIMSSGLGNGISSPCFVVIVAAFLAAAFTKTKKSEKKMKQAEV